MKLSALGTAQKRPRNWDKRVSAAYFRMCGFTQKEAARAAGLSERTIRNYETHPSFFDAKEEARNRWFVSLDVRARGALFDGLGEKGKGELGLRVLERLDQRLAPPNQRYERTGKGGKPIEITHVEHDVSADTTNGTDPKLVKSIGSAKTAFRNTRQAAHDGPGLRPNRPQR